MKVSVYNTIGLMDQTSDLVETLKKILKSRGLTYSDLARDLGLSEASVKRVFAEKSFTLDRLNQVCDVLGITFYDLAKQSRPWGDSGVFTEDQETELAADPRLFSFFYILISGWAVESIPKDFEISASEVSRLLLRLDRLHLIELKAKNAFKPLVSRHVKWRVGGPLMARYQEQMKDEFFASHFQAEGELLRFVAGKFTPKTVESLKRKVMQLLADYDDLGEADESSASALENYCLLVAYRPYTLSVISGLKKRQTSG